MSLVTVTVGDLTFTGILLADESSREGPDQDRWMEVRIYRVGDGGYVTEIVGRSTRHGEVDLTNAVYHDDADTIPDALMRRSGHVAPYMTITAQDALAEAARKDSRVMRTAEQYLR